MVLLQSQDVHEKAQDVGAARERDQIAGWLLVAFALNPLLMIALPIVLGIYLARRASGSMVDFFVGGRSLPMAAAVDTVWSARGPAQGSRRPAGGFG